jgi:heterodisulfide reductase subunit C2
MTHLLTSRINTEECFQCQKCSAGCPIAPHMDYKPHQVIQMLALGMHDRLLACRTIWVCASCYTCSTRCPNDVDVAGVMDQLRQTALRQGVPPAEKDVPLFHRAFLDSIRFHGRVHELSMMARYKIATHRYLDDMKLGLRMFTKGKLKLLPSRIADKNQIQRMFSKAVPPKGDR